MDRTEAISDLADIIADINIGHPIRLGIDGVDASGKTMLADELVEPLQLRGRNVIRVSIDGFHNPSDIRYRKGRLSPQGYYDDSFNYPAIIINVLEPLGSEGNLEYRPAVFDFRTDSEVDAPLRRAEPESILIFDGIFLQRPELKQYWDFIVFVHADFDVTIKRAQRRDLYLFETAKNIRQIYEIRYIPSEIIYLEADSPLDGANVIWDNNDIENPKLTVNKPHKTIDRNNQGR